MSLPKLSDLGEQFWIKAATELFSKMVIPVDMLGNTGVQDKLAAEQYELLHLVSSEDTVLFGLIRGFASDYMQGQEYGNFIMGAVLAYMLLRTADQANCVKTNSIAWLEDLYRKS